MEMKKVLFGLLMLFVFVGIVKAEEWPYLEDIKVNNALQEIEFDKEKNDYLVYLSNEDTKLDIDYVVDEEYEVLVDGNENLKTNSKVTIEVVDGDKTNTYTLTIIKKEVDKKEKKDSKKEEKKSSHTLIIVGILVAIVVICLVIAYCIKKKN